MFGPKKIALSDGGWFDKKQAKKVATWAAPKAGIEGYHIREELWQTAKGTLVFHELVPIKPFGVLPTVNYKNVWHEVTPDEIVVILIERKKARKAHELFPEAYDSVVRALSSAHAAAER